MKHRNSCGNWRYRLSLIICVSQVNSLSRVWATERCTVDIHHLLSLSAPFEMEALQRHDFESSVGHLNAYRSTTIPLNGKYDVSQIESLLQNLLWSDDDESDILRVKGQCCSSDGNTLLIQAVREIVAVEEIPHRRWNEDIDSARLIIIGRSTKKWEGAFNKLLAK